MMGYALGAGLGAGAAAPATPLVSAWKKALPKLFNALLKVRRKVASMVVGGTFL